MKYQSTPRFDREFRKFPQMVQKAFRKQTRFLIDDIRHPVLESFGAEQAIIEQVRRSLGR